MKNNINYISEGSGIPLVFQHGLTADVNQIQNLLGGLEGIHLLSIDCPGHGASELSKGYGPSFDKYADEIVQFMQRQNIDKAILGGLSMGSGIALNIAIRHPKMVQALIIHRPAWLDEGNPENLRILLPAADMLSEENGMSRFKQLPEFEEMESVVPKAASSLLGVFSPDQRKELPVVIRGMVSDRPITDMIDLDRIKVPCLILANNDDPLHPFAMALKLQNRIKGSTLVKLTSRYIDNDAHNDEVRENISTFVGQLNFE